MLTLEEAINFYNNSAEEHGHTKEVFSNKSIPYACHEYIAEHYMQLAEWLRELKFYKDRQDLINKSWQELINYKEGIEKIKMRSQAYRECGENILASGMEQALDMLKEVNADERVSN